MRGSLALLVRSLRQDARSLRAHLLRFVFVLFIVACVINAHDVSPFTSAPGLKFFQSIAWITFSLITLSGISFFSTAITEEKEEMTLGLLRMAGVGPVTILLGKGTTRLVISLLVLAAQFPFTLLAVTLGGVITQQILAVYAALVAYMLMLGNMGLLVSVCCRTSRWASFMMTVVLGAYFFGPLILATSLPALISEGILSAKSPFVVSLEATIEWLVESNVFVSLESIMVSSFNDPVITFQVVSNLVAAVLFFGLSWLLFGLFNREERSATAEQPLFGRRSGPTRWLSVPRAWSNALLWKDFHYMAGGGTMMIIKFLAYSFLILFVFFLAEINRASLQRGEALGIIAMWMSAVIFVVEMCVHSSRIFREEIRWKTFSSIAMLPISMRELVYSKWAGCLLALIPTVCLFLFGVMLNPDEFADFLSEVADEPIFFYLLLQIVLCWHICTLLSTFIKYGALPLSVVIIYFGNMCCGMVLVGGGGGGGGGGVSPDGLAILGSFASLGGIAILQVVTIDRLRMIKSQ